MNIELGGTQLPMEHSTLQKSVVHLLGKACDVLNNLFVTIYIYRKCDGSRRIECPDIEATHDDWGLMLALLFYSIICFLLAMLPG